MSQNGEGGSALVGLIGLSLFGWVYYAGGINNAWYSLQYSVWPEKVDVPAKPSDCDFIRAPLGDKGCTYQAHVITYNAAGNWVGGDDAPKYGRDSKTGKPIISHDNGKTWDWWPAADIPDPKITNVVVTWVKKTK